jgi:hypothetical protein
MAYPARLGDLGFLGFLGFLKAFFQPVWVFHLMFLCSGFYLLAFLAPRRSKT